MGPGDPRQKHSFGVSGPPLATVEAGTGCTRPGPPPAAGAVAGAIWPGGAAPELIAIATPRFRGRRSYPVRETGQKAALRSLLIKKFEPSAAELDDGALLAYEPKMLSQAADSLVGTCRRRVNVARDGVDENIMRAKASSTIHPAS